MVSELEGRFFNGNPLGLCAPHDVSAGLWRQSLVHAGEHHVSIAALRSGGGTRCQACAESSFVLADHSCKQAVGCDAGPCFAPTAAPSQEARMKAGLG